MIPEVSQAGGNVFVLAVQWLQATLLGTVATAVAVIAVASIGFLLLSGRTDVRRAVQVILGCFILFGASSIASGIMRGLAGPGPPPGTTALPPPPIGLPVAPDEPMKAVPYDPYAGAAVPVRR